MTLDSRQLATIAAALFILAAGCRDTSTAGLDRSGAPVDSSLAPSDSTPIVQVSSLIAAGGGPCGTIGGLTYCWPNLHDEPVLLPQMTGLHGLAAGGVSSCGLSVDGQGFCWGTNTNGELGAGPGIGQPWQPGDFDNQPGSVSPLPVEATERFQMISVGSGSACAIDMGGRAYCWGDNDHSAGYFPLGTGDTGDRAEDHYGNTFPIVSRPAPVLGDMAFSTIANGYQSTCALDSVGALYCWGTLPATPGAPFANTPTRIAPDAHFQSLSYASAGCALDFDGAAYCFAASGPLARVQTTLTFREIATIGGIGAPLHTCAITNLGDAYCWGDNSFGQLGDGTQASHDLPTLVLGGHHFTSIAVGSQQSCAAAIDGTAYCWGNSAVSTVKLLQPIPVALRAPTSK